MTGALKKFADRMVNSVFTAGAQLVLVAEYHNNPQITNQRRRVCRGSERHGIPACVNYNPDRDQCKVCSCIIEEKSKSKINYNPKKGMRAEITHCPLGLWEDEEIAQRYKE